MLPQLLTGWLLFRWELGAAVFITALPIAGVSLAVGVQMKRASRLCLFLIYVIAAYYLSTVALFGLNALDYPKVLGMAWRLRYVISETAWASFAQQVPPASTELPRLATEFDAEIAKYVPEEIEWLLHRGDARLMLSWEGVESNGCMRVNVHLSNHQSSAPGVLVLSGSCSKLADPEKLFPREYADGLVDTGPRIEVRTGLWVYFSHFQRIGF